MTIYKYFNSIMILLYITYTICTVENFIQFCSVVKLFKIPCIVVISQLIEINQIQILDFIDFNSLNLDELMKKNLWLWMILQSFKPVQIKFGLLIGSRIFLFMRLLSLQEEEEIDSFIVSFFIFLGLLGLLYVYHQNYYQYQEAIQTHNLLKCIETQNFEIILSKTLSNKVSDAVLFYSFDSKKISYNKQLLSLLQTDLQNLEAKKSKDPK